MNKFVQSVQIVWTDLVGSTTFVIATKQHEQQLNGRITSQFSPEAASQIRSQRYLAYNTASNVDSKKFLKLLDNLRNNSTSNYTSDDNSPNPINTASNRDNNCETSNTPSPKTVNEAKLALTSHITLTLKKSTSYPKAPSSASPLE